MENNDQQIKDIKKKSSRNSKNITRESTPNPHSESYSMTLGPGIYSLGVYSLRVYSLGFYNLVRRDLVPSKHSLGLGVYSLGVYNPVRRSQTSTH